MSPCKEIIDIEDNDLFKKNKNEYRIEQLQKTEEKLNQDDDDDDDEYESADENQIAAKSQSDNKSLKQQTKNQIINSTISIPQTKPDLQ
jgi:hypothetical protein